MTAPRAHAVQESLLSPHLCTRFSTGLIFGHHLPHVAALMARAQVTLTLALPAKRANLTPDDLVKCLLMALFDQTWVPCPLLEPCATLWGERRGSVAPQREMGVLFPKPGVWMLGRENHDRLLRCPVLGVRAAQGQHPTRKPPGAPWFPTPTSFFLDIQKMLFRHSFSLRPLMFCPGVREWELKTRRQALGQGAAGGPQGPLPASSPPPPPRLAILWWCHLPFFPSPSSSSTLLPASPKYLWAMLSTDPEKVCVTNM